MHGSDSSACTFFAPPRPNTVTSTANKIAIRTMSLPIFRLRGCERGELDDSRQRGHHPIPGDHQQGYEGSSESVDKHPVAVLRAPFDFLPSSRHCYHCHARPLPPVDSINIRL